ALVLTSSIVNPEWYGCPTFTSQFFIMENSTLFAECYYYGAYLVHSRTYNHRFLYLIAIQLTGNLTEDYVVYNETCTSVYYGYYVAEGFMCTENSTEIWCICYAPNEISIFQY